MDNIKFGVFLAQLRKEQGWTQKDLAEQLHVTDKAVSKWERGLGFPDIKLLEPLADLLHVSIAELIRSERIEPNDSSNYVSSEIASAMINLTDYQRKLEHRNTVISLFSAVSLLLLAFLFVEIGHIDLLEFLFTYFWILCLAVSFVLLMLCLVRRRNGLHWQPILALSLVIAAFPIILFFLFLLLAYAGLIFSR